MPFVFLFPGFFFFKSLNYNSSSHFDIHMIELTTTELLNIIMSAAAGGYLLSGLLFAVSTWLMMQVFITGVPSLEPVFLFELM